MKVLITGGSGFLGSHIIESANSKTKIKRIGRNSEDDFFWDISEPPPVASGNYQQIIHCAGKAHSLPKSEKESQEFFNVNFKGTTQLTEALSKYPPK